MIRQSEHPPHGEPRRCGSCGDPIPPRRSAGRPSAYCSNACRQRAFRKRRSEKPDRHVPESNLPHPLDRFVGRTTELTTLREAMRTSRLLTVAGAGGVGKSRLAVEALRRSPGDVCWVGLASVREGETFREAVATAFGAPADAGDLGPTLVSAIGGGRRVLVFDECEHVLEPCAELIAELLGGCPAVRVVATSREPLRIPGEKVVRIEPLPIPGGDRYDRADVLAFDSVRLFVNRAQDIVAGKEFTDSELACAVRICRELDGLPMAIELAARRIESLPVCVIERGLRGRFELLTGDLRGSALRTRYDLRGMVEWSYVLLTEAERTVLRRLSICKEGFSVTAAQAICTGGGITRRDVLGLLLSLNYKSMLERASGQESDPRFRLLETVRLYAREQLIRSGEAEEIVARGVGWLVPFLRPLITDVCVSSEATEVLCAEQVHLENAVKAIESDVDDPDTRVLLATGLAWVWQHRGRSEAAHELLTAALAAAPRSRYRAALFISLSWQSVGRGLHPRARQYAIDAVRAAHEEGMPELRARALRQLAVTHLGDGRTSLLLYRKVLDAVSDPRQVAVVRQELAWALALCGRAEDARVQTDLAMPEFRQATHEHAAALCTSAAASIVGGRWDDAHADLVHALRTVPAEDFVWPYVVEGLGVVAEHNEDVPTAALLFAAAEANRDSGAAQPVPAWRVLTAPSVTRVRERLSERDRVRAWRRGGAMTADDLISLVAEEDVADADRRGTLTPREHQVAAMLADGLTNQQIALRMGITTRTVANHLDRVKRKLGLSTRALIMRWYLDRTSSA